MTVKTVTQVGNPLIRGKARKVSNPKSKSVQTVIKTLVESMRHHGLVGMAAPQVGKNLRIFVSEVRNTKLRKGQTKKNLDPLRVFINPKIISYSKNHKAGWEGCGSVASAQLFGKVMRPTAVVVEAHDGAGRVLKLRATNLLARIIQHEMDHINGIVFTDRANLRTLMSRNEYLKKFAKKA